MKRGFSNASAHTWLAATFEKVSMAAACSSRPNRRGIQRAWRMPTQKAPAPSSDQTAEVHCASSASGTASVAKPTPTAVKHSTSSW